MPADRFYGVYRGVCVQNADPEKRLRVTLRVPQVLGDQETGWAWPCVPPAWSDSLLTPNDGAHAQTSGDGRHTHTLARLVPNSGEGVWVMFEAGDLAYPVWLGVFR